MRACPANQVVSKDGQCVCAGNAALVATEDSCVVPGQDPACPRRTANADNVQTCITSSICSGTLKLQLNGDGVTCVSTCEKTKYSEDEKTKELKCVDKCEHWWYKEQKNGLCKKEAWRKNTAIAVPIVIVVLAGAAVGVFFLIKSKKGSSTTSSNKSKSSVQTQNNKMLNPVNA